MRQSVLPREVYLRRRTGKSVDRVCVLSKHQQQLNMNALYRRSFNQWCYYQLLLFSCILNQAVIHSFRHGLYQFISLPTSCSPGVDFSHLQRFGRSVMSFNATPAAGYMLRLPLLLSGACLMLLVPLCISTRLSLRHKITSAVVNSVLELPLMSIGTR